MGKGGKNAPAKIARNEELKRSCYGFSNKKYAVDRKGGPKAQSMGVAGPNDAAGNGK